MVRVSYFFDERSIFFMIFFVAVMTVKGLRENFRVFCYRVDKSCIKNIFKRVVTSFLASVVNFGDFYSLIKVTLN